MGVLEIKQIFAGGLSHITTHWPNVPTSSIEINLWRKKFITIFHFFSIEGVMHSKKVKSGKDFHASCIFVKIKLSLELCWKSWIKSPSVCVEVCLVAFFGIHSNSSTMRIFPLPNLPRHFCSSQIEQMQCCVRACVPWGCFNANPP